MPLIIVTGLPSSGKTYRTQQILDDFNARIASTSQATAPHLPNGLSTQHLASYHASLDTPCDPIQPKKPEYSPTNPRDVIYNSAREEKIARAEEFSAAKRALSKNNIVIADAPNYIKGFRYQMWCEAKAAGTRCVVVHVAAREDECRKWNEERIKSWGWDDLLKVEEEDDTKKSKTRIAKNVQEVLQPESHTAIYGDRLGNDVQEEGARSRSSSMGGDASDDDGDADAKNQRDITKAMTLKSLYISNDDSRLEANGNSNGTESSNIPQLPSKASQDISSTGVTTVARSAPPSPTASLPYLPSTFQSLSMRYEPPSPFTRWDTPLFTIPATDTHPPYQAIWDAIFPPPIKPARKIIPKAGIGEATEPGLGQVRQSNATVLPKVTGAEALQTLESATADVVKILLATARERGAAEGEGGRLEFTVPDPKSGNDINVEVEIPLNTMLSQPALQRLRRRYTQIQRGGIAHGQRFVSGRAEIVRDFSRFLEAEWNTD